MATGNPTSAPATAAKSMNAANKGQISEALIIQAYANSVEQQPQVDFGSVPSLKTYQTSVNDGLTKAKAHASNYLTVIQPQIIKNMSNIGNYYAIHDSVAKTLPAGSTLADWNKVLHTLQSQAETYQRDAKVTTNSLKTLHDALNQDVSTFGTIVQELNTAVGGDHGVLNSINGQISSLKGQIDGAIAAVVVSGLSIAGGVFMICVGSISDFVTAGTTTPLVFGGIGMVAGGVAGEVKASVTLAGLLDKQASLLTKEAQLTSEVKLATGIQGGYASLFKKVKDAASASLKMELAWQTLAGDLGTLISDLNKGLMTADQLRTLFLTDANHDVQTVIKDINIMKAQMAGVTELAAKTGNSLSQLVTATAQANQQPKPTILMAQITPQMLAVSKSNPSTVAKTVNNANKHQTSQALIIQNYANSVNEQPMVNFSGEKNLFKYEQEVNTGLQTAQGHANNYLNKIQPSIITNISNIGNYYALHDAVTTALPAGATEAEWLQALTALETQSKTYKTHSNQIVKDLETLRTGLSTDSAQFTKVVTELNAAINGDHGVLDSIRSQLSTIQSQIDGAIAGTALSGLAIAGGVFMIAVGAVTDFVTAGASTPLVIGGVAVVAAGVAGEVASAITLESLNNEKAKLLTEKANLKAEVTLATGIEGGYQSLHNQVSVAVKAATGMLSAWESLSADLGSMITDLNKGITSPGFLRTLFLTAANTTVKTVIADISTIKQQMSGVDQIVAKKGQTVGQAIVAAAKGTQPTALFVKASPSTQAQIASGVPSVKPISLFAKAPSGALSQSVANLQHSENQLKSISNLPSPAQRIQSESLSKIPLMIQYIDAMQNHVGDFVKVALPDLDDILKMLKNNEVLEKIGPYIVVARANASSLDALADQILTAIQRLTSTVYGYFKQLSQIEVVLTNQMTGLQAQLGNARNREKAAQKEYYYFLSLGPFGLAGLATALASWNSTKKEVYGYENKIKYLDFQINLLNGMKKVTGQLGTDFQDVINEVASVKNSVSFVSNDILKVQSEINTKEPRTVIEIEVNAAIAEVKTLSVDALGSVV